MNENLSTKSDMMELRKDVALDFQKAKSELKQEISDFRVEVKQDFATLQDKLTIRMGAMFAGTIAILGSLKFI